EYRVKNFWAYAQDDWKATQRLTFNLGFRYEHKGNIADKLGRNANIDLSAINPNPPAGGTISGYIVPSNFEGTIPAGVSQIDNAFGIKAEGDDVFAPRLGFAWQVLPNSTKLVLRGGYGIYYTQLTGQQYLQIVTTPPFSQIRQLAVPSNPTATFAN